MVCDGRITVINPATLDPLKDALGHNLMLPVDGSPKLREMVRTARNAQAEWAETSVAHRLRVFHKLKKILKRDAQRFAATIMSETGKVPCDAMVDVVSAAAEIHDIETNGKAYWEETERPVKTHFALRNKEARNARRPKGVVGVISPWNLPLAIPAADIFPAIFRRNAVIAKPSEYTPLTLLDLVSAMREAGFPRDLFQVALGDGGTGRELCELADCVSFTGSCRTGAQVKAICESRGISCNLEMGGKAPAIVLADADLDRAAYGLVYGAFANSGQYCISFERVYAHRSILNELVERILRITNRLVPGKDYGPLVTGFQFEIVKRQVEEAQAQGAWAATGGLPLAGMRGFWFRPTVLLYADHGMAVMREETFGPVMPIMGFGDEEEAVRFANDSHLGLNASIFTRDKNKFFRLAERIEAGNVVGNDSMINWFIPGVSQCGCKGSTSRATGLARHGRSGYERFDDEWTPVWHKHAIGFLPPLERKEPWWLPYTDFTRMALQGFLRFF